MMSTLSALHYFMMTFVYFTQYIYLINNLLVYYICWQETQII